MIDLWEEDDGVVGFFGLRMRERGTGRGGVLSFLFFIFIS